MLPAAACTFSKPAPCPKRLHCFTTEAVTVPGLSHLCCLPQPTPFKPTPCKEEGVHIRACQQEAHLWS